jgi:DNA-binding beta-propeller fold protein YncE
LAIDSDRGLLFATDAFNNRVLVFDINSISNHESAIFVLGQNNFNTYGCNDQDTNLPSASTMCQPWGLAYDSDYDRLFVSERGNHRVLVFDVSQENLANGISASYVLGQPDFQSKECNQGQVEREANTMCYPNALDYNVFNHRLFVSDPWQQ